MILTGKQKRYLRALAVNENAIFQIGKDGLNDNLYKSVLDALKPRELVKISVLKTCELDTRKIAEEICLKTNSELVQIIGRTIVIYKRNTKEPKILLP